MAGAGVILLAVASACGDSAGPDVGPPASVTAQAGQGQNAAVGTAVATAPSVIVRDSDGNPVPNVPVTFAVASGGGSVSGGTTATNGSGIATVGGWTLGTAAGANTLTATVPGVSTPATFTATGVAGSAAAISAETGNNQTATVGSPVAIPPTVRVADQYGNPKSGVSVTFAVASGGGAATGTAVTTAANGHATAGSWTLGTAAGPNTLTASVSGLTPLTFSSTAAAGPAASVAVQSGNNQSAPAGTAVPVAPSVVVRDQHDNPVQGATVSFTVVSGGGTATGTTPTTNAQGIASVGSWTLGPNPGTNVLRATVTGLAAVDFTATGTGDACTIATPLPVPGTVNGSLTTTDCEIATGDYADRYSLTLPATSSLELRMSSSAFDPFLILADAQEDVVAYNDDRPSDLNSTIRIVAGAGTYTLYALGADEGVTGAYAVSAAAASANVAGCQGSDIPNMMWITPNVTTSQTLASTDCRVTEGTLTYYADRLAIFMIAGRTYTITQSSSAFDTYLFLLDANGDVAAENDDQSATDENSRIVFTAPTTGNYVIEASSFDPETGGAYQLTVAATAPTTAARGVARVGQAPPRPIPGSTKAASTRARRRQKA